MIEKGGKLGPHQGQPVLTAGAGLEEARAAMILLHGRGADARDVLALAQEFARGEFAYMAPQAANLTWYPYGFMAPIEANEPGLSSGLALIGELLGRMNLAGIPSKRIFLLGFSQGACLALEYAARYPSRYGGIVGLSGGLIGPEVRVTEGTGSLDGTPMFLGCSDVDLHIPLERVRETARLFELLGGEVTERIYPGMGHMVNRDEIEAVKGMMEALGKEEIEE